MHMADALISPAVGGIMWAATAGLTVYSAKKLREDPDERRVPLMGVLGAFVFAAQMINFSIPGTGSSGHMGGGMLLCILMGPYAAFLTMASVLVVQALFFADGGLLALGCNVCNLGFFTSFIAYPLIYKHMAGNRPSPGRIMAASLAASILGLQMGALGVVLETALSGISDLPVTGFLLLMQPIHLAIGVVEGMVTAALVGFLYKARPEIMGVAGYSQTVRAVPLKTVLAGFVLAAVLTGGVFSWFASSAPDGLEWALHHVTGKTELEAPAGGVHGAFAGLQEQTVLFPDYDFKKSDEGKKPVSAGEGGESVVRPGASVSGLVGGCSRRFWPFSWAWV